MSLTLQEASAIAISVTLILAYYAFLFHRGRHAADFTIHAVNARARQLWVQHVMNNEGKDLMAVQTLRNLLMAATFMGTTAMVLVIGVLSLTGQADARAKAWQVLSIASPQTREWWLVKILCLLLVLIVAFFAFAMVLRQINHLIFMIGLPKNNAQGPFAPDRVARQLNQAAVFYTIGMRAFFITIPLVFWLFGPVFLVVATAGMIAVLYLVDRSPLAESDQSPVAPVS